MFSFGGPHNGGDDPVNPQMGGFLQGFFGAMGSGGTFDVQYHCYPVSFLGREELEKGNKILLPQSALDQLARLNVSYPMLFQISNLKEPRTTHCGVLEFTAEEGFCYIPYWMMQNLVLQEGDIVRVKNVSLPKGRSVKLQPVTKDFLEIHNPRAILENSLRNFAALTAGDNIAIQYNNKTFEIEVVECKPANAISIIEADVSVEFLAPKDYVEPSPSASQAEEMPGTSTGAPGTIASSDTQSNAENIESASLAGKTVLFQGKGMRLDGKPLSSKQAKATPVVVGADGRNMSDPWGDKPWTHRVPHGVPALPPFAFRKVMAEKRNIKA
ncbi:conserved hypothetical protein [Perkinsus marinus ATCC 50983]|uniref:Ubiquitin fusion degradation protein n=1 Tax=Perkinsus marinus (strain ATCC 50983 / TXsc) TaxID=423536 RepID=C5K6P7_PERM5|nr:conserved hypothetical protein [Perkinsus marinus ATCC 50983]EER19967.1 conserved hypothetical protein [Perkinsus marinus ATCC 50983]|eukprot:XP_002788171.1 conserved hypothetical protein [Perkinsus marinus ATCC 50983]